MAADNRQIRCRITFMWGQYFRVNRWSLLALFTGGWVASSFWMWLYKFFWNKKAARSPSSALSIGQGRGMLSNEQPPFKGWNLHYSGYNRRETAWTDSGSGVCTPLCSEYNIRQMERGVNCSNGRKEKSVWKRKGKFNADQKGLS